MPRPRKCRKICRLPDTVEFTPVGGDASAECVVLTVDEFEAVRLIDDEGYSQEECGEYMLIARTTVQQIYLSARRKIARALVNGLPLRIAGGDFRLCDSDDDCPRRGGCCERRRRFHEATTAAHDAPHNEERIDTVMKIAVAANGKEVSGHFGHSEQFIVYDVEQNAITAEQCVANPGHRPGLLPNMLADMGVKTVIAGGMGAHAAGICAERGVEVITGAQGDARSAAEAYLRGELHSTGEMCTEHGHHDHGEGEHGHCHGHGDGEHGHCHGHGEGEHGHCHGGEHGHCHGGEHAE